MSKITSTIFTTIILLSVAFAKRHGKGKRIRDYSLRSQAHAKPLIPETFNECWNNHLVVGKNALTQAAESNLLNNLPVDIDSLEYEQCSYSMDEYDWLKFNYKHGDSDCEVYVVVSYRNFQINFKKGKYGPYFFNLNKELTEKANKEAGKCVNPNQFNGKVDTDIKEENDSNTSVEQIDESVTVQNIQPAIHSNIESSVNHNIHPAVHNNVEPIVPQNIHHTVHSNVNPIVNLEVNPFVDQDDNIEYHTYGPSKTHLPLRPQEDQNEPVNRKDLLEETDESVDNTDEVIGQPEPKNVFQPGPIGGGWSVCSEEHNLYVRQAFSKLMLSNVLKSKAIYKENIVACHQQVVNGMNYNIVFSFNKKQCELSVYDMRGQVRLSKMPRKFPHIADCAEVYAA